MPKELPPKLKAVGEAISQIKERFGDGSIMRFGEAKRSVVDVIPTGCLSLDLALGVGGVPRGRIIEIFGMEASGKCVNRDTLVLSDKGMFPMDAFGYLSIPEFQKRETYIYAEHSFEKTSHFYNGGRRRTLRLKTKRGFALEGTPNHQIRVLDRDGNYLFRRLDELRTDDRIAIQRNQQCFGEAVDLSGFSYQRRPHDTSSKPFPPPKKLTKAWALLMGYLVGDGTCTERGLNRNVLQLTAADEEIVADFQSLCLQLFGEKARVTFDRRGRGHVRRLAYHSAQARQFLVYAGLGWWDAGGKEIPWSIRSAPKAIIAAFLSALFACDGCFSGATIEYCTKSERLARQLHVMLLNFGIVASRKQRRIRGYDAPYWYLYIEGQEDKKRFAQQIGFRVQRKQRLLLKDLAKKKIFKTNLDVIPYMGDILERFIAQFRTVCRALNRADWNLIADYLSGRRSGGHALTYDRLRRLLRHFADGRNIPEYQQFASLNELGFYWDAIHTVQPSLAHVVDFTVPKGSTFFGNGFVNHNTTLAQHIVAEVQKLGGIAAFVDAEHALDPEYAKKIGVKVDELLISQPDTGEQALEIVETLVRSNAVDVIVIDSVAALVPKAEIEGEMGESHMGLQARLMSQALRKLTAIVSKTKTTVIFINQIRMKIGVFFGNPETTTGGTALKFYSSVRIEVRRSAQIKQNDKIIGNRVKAKIVKNKVASPFRTTEFDIMYNEGISLSGDLIDTGVALEVVKKSGNSYSYGETKLGVGRETAKQYLRENPKLMAEIRAKCIIAAETKEHGEISKGTNGANTDADAAPPPEE